MQSFSLYAKLTRSNSPRSRVSSFAVPKTQSEFPRRARWNASRSHERQQFRSSSWSAHIMPWFGFTMTLATWSRRTRIRAISKSR